MAYKEFKELYLMWVPGQPSGWGVFDYTSCPDPGAFPSWMYRQYTVPKERWSEIFNKLKKIKENLDVGKVVPTKDTEKNIFPEISDLLADSPQSE